MFSLKPMYFALRCFDSSHNFSANQKDVKIQILTQARPHSTMVSIDYLILFHKSMYVMTQLWYLSRNLATIQVSELQMSFVTFTQTDTYVVYLKFLQISILKK